MSGALSAYALCWAIERRDGAGLALTSHDEAIHLDGVVYEPAPGMIPASVRRGSDLDPRAGEVRGALTSEAIGEGDLIAGRWDGASVSLRAVDWSAPGASIELSSGQLGSVQQKDRQFEAELLGAAARLRTPVCPATSPECRAELGDAACRVDMAGRSARVRLVSADGLTLTLDSPVDERFVLGRLRVLGGQANGIQSTIVAAAGDRITVRSLPPVMLQPGVALELVEGCDKRLATCAARFANAANFQGEPHLPGNDLLTRYPGS